MCPSPITTIPNSLSTSPAPPRSVDEGDPAIRSSGENPRPAWCWSVQNMNPHTPMRLEQCFSPDIVGIFCQSSHRMVKCGRLHPCVLDSCDPARHFLGLTVGFARTMCLASLQNRVISILSGTGFPIGILDPIVFCTNREIDRFRRQRMRCRQYFSR